MSQILTLAAFDFAYSANTVVISDKAASRSFGGGGGGNGDQERIITHQHSNLVACVSPQTLCALAVAIFTTTNKQKQMQRQISDMQLALFVRTQSACLKHLQLLATHLSVKITLSHRPLHAALHTMHALQSLTVSRPEDGSSGPTDAFDSIFSSSAVTLQHLEYVDLSETRGWFTDASASHLARLPNLRSVSLANTLIGPDGVVEVAKGCPALRELRCGTLGGRPAIHAEHMAALSESCAPRLTSFSLHKSVSVPEASFISFIKSLERIQHLDLSHNAAVNDSVIEQALASTSPSSSLRSLKIANCRITSAGLNSLASNHKLALQLQLFDLSYSTFSVKDKETQKVLVPAITDEDLGNAVHAMRLTSFVATDMGDVVGKKTLSALAGLSSLQTCDISSGSGDLDDDLVIAIVANNAELKHLVLGSYERERCLSDKAFVALAGCKANLETVDILSAEGNRDVSDDGLVALVEKKGGSIKSLGIDGCSRATDAVVAALVRHSPQLEDFHFGGTRITESAAMLLERRTNFKRGVYI